MSIDRRTLLLALPAGLLAARAGAHHGWSSFDESAPLYLEGVARDVRWQNPHVELVVDVSDDLALPADLAKRSVPAQKAQVDGPGLLARAKLPARRGPWTCELAPLTRMQAWAVPRIAPGDRVAMLGYTFAGDRGERTLRAEYIWLGGRAYPLRSLPA